MLSLLLLAWDSCQVSLWLKQVEKSADMASKAGVSLVILAVHRLCSHSKQGAHRFLHWPTAYFYRGGVGDGLFGFRAVG